MLLTSVNNREKGSRLSSINSLIPIGVVINMANNLIVCDVHPDLVEKLKKFKFRKSANNAALICKVDAETKVIVLEEELEDCTPEDIQEELPEHMPRYIIYSYCLKHDDGRISYPLCFIFCSPQGCKPEMQMMYAGSKLHLVNTGGFTKVFEVRSPEDITEEWLLEKLKFFH